MSLKGKTAVITGVGSEQSIGYAIAQELILEGVSKLYIIDINDKVLAAKQSLIDFEEYARARCLGVLDTFAGTPITIHAGIADMGGYEEVQKVIKDAHTLMGSIDILHNVAGINLPGDVFDLDVKQYERMYRVNVFSQFYAIKEVAPIMKEQGGGVIVNMASANATVAEKYLVGYVGTKGAVATETRAHAVDLAPHGIRVNAVAPGLVHTGFNDAHHNVTVGGRENVHPEEFTPLGRDIKASEIARVAAFLSGDRSSGMLGQVVYVDGGISVI